MPLIVDLAMHEKAGLSKQKFVDLVRPVEAIRTNRGYYEEGLTLYIHSLESFMLHRHLRNVVTSGDFDGFNGHFHCYHAGIDVADPLYNWYLNTDQDTILRQMVCWLAALYAFDLDRRPIMERQLYPPVFKEVAAVARDYFRIETSHVLEEGHEWTEFYHNVAMAYYNSRPPALIERPIPLFAGDELSEWRVHDQYDLRINRFYFRNDDWTLLKEGKIDALLRTESSREDWVRIKHQFVAGANERRTVFSLFDASPEKGTIYIIREGNLDRYKIGYTNAAPEKRMAVLQTGNSNLLSMVGGFPCSGRRTERVLHDLFKHARLSGEWFALDQKELSTILDSKWRAEKGVF